MPPSSATSTPTTRRSPIRSTSAPPRRPSASRRRPAGKVEIQMFPNNQLGSDTDMLSQLRSGAIEFFTLSGLILSTLVPVASINGVGFAFKDYGQVWPAMDGALGALRARRDRQARPRMPSTRCGTTAIARSPASTKPIKTPDDLKGFKIRVPASPLWTSMFKAFGASPTTHQLQRGLLGAADQGRRRPGEPAVADRHRQALRGAEVLSP